MLKNMHSHVKRLSKTTLIIIGVVILVLLCIIALRVQAAIKLKKETKAHVLPVVNVTKIKAGHGIETLILPGNVQAWHEATIYARTSGYIKKWYVDIGSPVKAGQLLAEIEAPELDAQLRQAQADLNTAIANNVLAQSTAKRWIALLKTKSVSQQETDEKISAASALNAAVIASKANVDRLQQLVNYERVIAPFDGIITSRTTDLGSLINAGSSSNGVALFKISQTDPLRIYVQIPQNYSARTTPNMKVTLKFAEHPGQKYPAQLIDTAKAIDPITRTLLAQFRAPNKKNSLLPGGYTEVSIPFPISTQTVRIPVNALLFQAQGLQVASVNAQNKVNLKKIKISRDYGSEIEVTSGIKPGERIIINPSDSILNGQEVRVAHVK